MTGRTSSEQVEVHEFNNCSATTSAGTPCQAAGGTRGLCASHDADMRGVISLQQSAGGASTVKKYGLDLAGAPLDVRSAEGLQELLRATASALATSRITSGQAKGLVDVVRAAAALLDREDRLKLAQLEQRLDALVPAARRR